MRLGYESPESNVIMVATGAVAGVEMYEPLLASWVPGGLRVVLHTPQTNLRIVDASGLTVLCLPAIGEEQVFSLNPGIYFVCTDQSKRPVRVAVR